MRHLGTMSRILLDALFGALLGVVVAAAVLTAVVPALGVPVVTITGGSMSPAIPIGAVAVEQPVRPADLRVGDVATFRLLDGGLVTHRIVRVGEVPLAGAFELKGDANAAPDPVMQPASALVGRVAIVLPAAGFLLWWLHVPSGLLAVASTAGCLYVARLLLEPVGEPTPRRREPGAPEATVA